MNSTDLIKALKNLKVQTGSLACLGCGWEQNCSTQGCRIIREAAAQLEALAIASDVAPVVHGRWIDLREDDMDYEWKCSSCGETFGMAHEDVSPYDVGLNYCPNCGAKMDLEG